jgi:pSer/pThr/pTyr-binding forkhead associated (FHA) protein
VESSIGYVLLHRGRHVVVRPGVVLIAGSTPDADILLPEVPLDLGPPRMARFIQGNDGLWLESLSARPAEPVYVNGEPVERARLEPGDRVLLGLTIVKVLPARAPR